MHLLFCEGDTATVGEVTDGAGVARSTFYRHHRSAMLVISDYRHYILSEYRHSMRHLLKNKRIGMPELCWQTLKFMLQNKKIFRVLVRSGDMGVFRQMARVVRPKIITNLHLPRNSNKIYLMLASEITALLVEWCDTGLHRTDMARLQEKMVWLASTARQRLRTVS